MPAEAETAALLENATNEILLLRTRLKTLKDLISFRADTANLLWNDNIDPATNRRVRDDLSEIIKLYKRLTGD